MVEQGFNFFDKLFRSGQNNKIYCPHIMDLDTLNKMLRLSYPDLSARKIKSEQYSLIRE
ncbi:UNKNOWN [Stylonychia lemnae]|uniref:Uncharacterized protein n=1 Tax=Stylonychia lemnae TaxID=5949 RepID=A0A078B2F8_STYLE|nr:UNKNOWN [Stylonychia lemnae]|eukprot:CDW88674.1 UNKNOWN [Stylonychia lemnae]